MSFNEIERRSRPFELWFWPLLVFSGLSFSFYSPFGFDEFRAPLKYLWGQFQPADGFFEAQVIQYKASIGLIRFLSYLNFFKDQAWISVALFICSATLAAYGIGRILARFNVPTRWAAFLALCFLTLAPTGYLSYGYHYKVGSSGPGFGLLAFAWMTFLCALALDRKIVSQCLGVLALYLIHPMNALFYTAFAFAVEFALSLEDRKKRNTLPLKGLIILGVLGVSLAAHALLSFGSGLSASDPMVLASLVRLVNGQGEAGAYFIPWLNPARLSKEIMFHVSLLLAVEIGARRGWIDSRWQVFYRGAFVFVALVCLGHYFLDRPGLERLLALDPSRMVSLLRPLGFVTLALIIVRRFQQGDREAAVLGFVLFLAHASLSVWVFPAVVATALFCSRRNLKIFLLGWALLSAALFAQKALPLLWGAGSLEPFTLLRGLLAVALVYGIFSQRRFVKVLQTAVGCFFLVLLAQNTWERYRTNSEMTVVGKELQSFFEAGRHPGDLVLSSDERFTLSNGIQGSLVAFHNATYGIYLGGLDRLAVELEKVWGVRLNPEWVLEQNEKYQSRGGFPALMSDRLQELSANDLQRIVQFAPRLRYVLISADQGLQQLSTLPLVEVFKNSGYTLYEIKRTKESQGS